MILAFLKAARGTTFLRANITLTRAHSSPKKEACSGASHIFIYCLFCLFLLFPGLALPDCSTFSTTRAFRTLDLTAGTYSLQILAGGAASQAAALPVAR
ncbi:MAG TPA: hypothetical protein VFA33_19100 [Bryobacteraceae bacterium]|nr:hypothetical protein [Bryobacteraceae bacterium]